jgi:hypothetical protein
MAASVTKVALSFRRKIDIACPDGVAAALAEPVTADGPSGSTGIPVGSTSMLSMMSTTECLQWLQVSSRNATTAPLPRWL